MLTVEPALRTHLTSALLPAPGQLVDETALRALPRIAPREYSAASILADGTLDLVVRQLIKDGGELGIGSGWLTAHLPIGTTSILRLRPNPGFRVPDDGRPLILIGNGTGIAGLRAHLRAAAHAGSHGHWLLFGERTRTYEEFFDAELTAWHAEGVLARIDRCFSRDADCGRYVQHALLENRQAVQDWIERGATILVCGSLEGMAQAVDEALFNILGSETVLGLTDDGRYKRDVY